MPDNPNVFDPPSAEQLERHLQRNLPASGIQWQTRAPLIALITLSLLLMMAGSPAFAMLPLLGVMGAMAYLASRARAAIELQQRVTHTWELAMIRRYRQALGRAWELLPLCRNRPDLHGRVVTVIAHILGELGRDEAAEVAYAFLLDRLPGDHPLALRLRVQRAVAALGADQLADADDELRKLRAPVQQANDPTLSGAYRLARLLQDVRTGHFADALNQAEQTAEMLKPLGVEAGYGHGLLAVCCQQLALHDPHADADQKRRLARHARDWWANATLLIPPAALLFRMPDTRVVAQHTDATSDDTPA